MAEVFANKINTALQDFNYTINETTGNYLLTGWKGTLNGVASTEVLVPNNSAIIVDPSGI